MTRRWSRDLADDLRANARRQRADQEAERAQQHDPVPPLNEDDDA